MYCRSLDKCDVLVYNKINSIIIAIDKNNIIQKYVCTRF